MINKDYICGNLEGIFLDIFVVCSILLDILLFVIIVKDGISFIG